VGVVAGFLGFGEDAVACFRGDRGMVPQGERNGGATHAEPGGQIADGGLGFRGNLTCQMPRRLSGRVNVVYRDAIGFPRPSIVTHPAMKTKTSRSSSAVLRLCGVALFASFHSLSAQTSSNLIEDATVRSTGTYTYYARGDANAASITPFTTMFYPGGLDHSGNATLYRDNGLDDSVDTTAPVGIGSGFLTNLGA